MTPNSDDGRGDRGLGDQRQHFCLYQMMIGKFMSSVEGDVDSNKLAIALYNDLGRNAFVVEEDDVIHLLRAAVKREGSQIAYADRYGVDRAIISAVLNGRRRISSSLVKALGLRKVYVFE